MIAVDDTGHDNRSRRLGRHWRDAGLKRHQIGVASPVQRDGDHHLAGDELPHLRAFSFHLHVGGVRHSHLFTLLAHLHLYVNL